MKDIEVSTSKPDGAAASADLENGPYAPILPLVRLLARQAAREDYARALEAARAKPYSTEGMRATRKAAEES